MIRYVAWRAYGIHRSGDLTSFRLYHKAAREWLREYGGKG